MKLNELEFNVFHCECRFYCIDIAFSVYPPKDGFFMCSSASWYYTMTVMTVWRGAII